MIGYQDLEAMFEGSGGRQGVYPPHKMGRMVIYLNRDFEPPGVAHYLD